MRATKFLGKVTCRSLRCTPMRHECRWFDNDENKHCPDRRVWRGLARCDDRCTSFFASIIARLGMFMLPPLFSLRVRLVGRGMAEDGYARGLAESRRSREAQPRRMVHHGSWGRLLSVSVPRMGNLLGVGMFRVRFIWYSITWRGSHGVWRVASGENCCKSWGSLTWRRYERWSVEVRGVVGIVSRRVSLSGNIVE